MQILNKIGGKEPDSLINWSRRSAVNGKGVIPERASVFLSPQSLHRLWGLPSLQSSGYRVLSAGVQRPGRKANDANHFTSTALHVCIVEYFVK